MIVLLVILFLLVALVVMLRNARTSGQGYVASAGHTLFSSAPPLRDHRPASPRRDFRAVSIHTGAGCCRAARALEGRRSFPAQMPLLPLPQCDAAVCQCRYEKHADRRSGETRRSVTAALPEDERRHRPDRRIAH